ncbi:MAG: hypothetical protein Phog2KO_32360 [Phototrophicaceae bacterium]
MVDNRNHDLFKLYPLSGRIKTSRGMLPSPYHVYDGKVSFIGGTVSYEGVKNLLATEKVSPIKTDKGRSFMGIWICDFTDASLSPHTELQFSFFVSRQNLDTVKSHEFALLHQLSTNPSIRMLVHGLWNNSETSIAYNNEVLALGAHASRGGVDFGKDKVDFLFNDYSHGSVIATGKLSIDKSTSLSVSTELLPLFGLGGVMRLGNQIIHTQVMNRISNVLPINATSQTYTSADKIILQRFNPANDKLTIAQSPYHSLDFKPRFIEHMLGFKFVFLNQHNRTEESL